ncbi:nuA4 complex subunit EAF3 homolog [Melanaphis sacchari]|uniref:nuA4 complex subunit EAF3 homolog n=1 Tax=Melanaphis sacchari TaxID=742174 RepID=UPI000DC13D98|nr:nuA4 complex subunit EAF3 homolog [Melanaphis sacchari]
MEEDYNFAEGQYVYVYFDNLLYEAKCMKRRKTDYGENQYFIHYRGWKSSWDEWIDENEALEINPINCRHRERLQENFDAKQKLKDTKNKNKIAKPKKNINISSSIKKRGRPRKVVTKKNIPCPRSVKNKKKPTTLVVKTSSQKKGKSKKEASKPKNNTIDKEVEDKIKSTNNESIPSTSTMESNIKTTENIISHTNKTEKLTNEIIENISETKPSQSIDIDNCNKFQPEYEPVQKRLKTCIENLTKESQDNTSNISVNATENIKEQVEEQSLISGPSHPVNVNNTSNISVNATENIEQVEEQSLISGPSHPVDVNNTSNISVNATENIKEQTEKDYAAICAVSEIYLSIIPFSKRLSNKLRFGMILPKKLKDLVKNDWIMNYHHLKMPKFEDNQYVANVAYTFTESYNFADDSQKKTSMKLCIRLLEYFNSIVHSDIAYHTEIKNYIQFKAITYFRDRLIDQPNKIYVLKEHIVPKKIWCYLYSPIYLLRLLVKFPFLLLKNKWEPECEIEFIVQYFNKMLQFLDDNFDTYFSAMEYTK